jgi:hypothetical protein
MISDIWSAFTHFLDSNFLSSIITLGVGFFAFRIYKKQKDDKKQDAANIVLQEIRNAEAQLIQAKEIIARDKVIPESIVAMNTRSWSKYGYLFIRDLTSEEWQFVDNFYEKCAQFDELVEYSKTFFKKNEEQIRVNLHQALGDYTKNLLTEVKKGFDIEDDKEQAEYYAQIRKNYEDELEVFYETFMKNITSADSKFFYSPKKPYEDVKVVIETVRLDLSTSTVGITLSKLANKN